jgi:tRNA G18 (ribose-2'-O)-methylase SpoU
VITVILENVRSAHNVGSIMRTLDAVGGQAIVCCALGAERSLSVSHAPTTAAALAALQRPPESPVIALEQAPGAVDLFGFGAVAGGDFVLIAGGEVDGIQPATLELCDAIVEIPQRGEKESLNVAVAVGVALYALTFR